MVQFSALQEEARKIGALVNLGELQVYMRRLREQLEGCVTAADKFQVMYQFLDSIPANAF